MNNETPYANPLEAPIPLFDLWDRPSDKYAHIPPPRVLKKAKQNPGKRRK